MRVAFCWILLTAFAAGAEYGEKVRYKPGRPLAFPDCDLTFVGTRRISSPKFERGFLFYDFAVVRQNHRIQISWSDGAGDIAPVAFKLGGTQFVLEIKYSEGLREWLGDNALVLWRADDFQKAAHVSH